MMKTASLHDILSGVRCFLLSSVLVMLTVLTAATAGTVVAAAVIPSLGTLRYGFLWSLRLGWSLSKLILTLLNSPCGGSLNVLNCPTERALAVIAGPILDKFAYIAYIFRVLKYPELNDLSALFILTVSIDPTPIVTGVLTTVIGWILTPKALPAVGRGVVPLLKKPR